jgi:hypothetical protein
VWGDGKVRSTEEAGQRRSREGASVQGQRKTWREAMTTMRNIMQKLKLTVNEAKTHVCRLPDESLDFLGVHHRPMLLDADGPGLFGHATVAEEGLGTVPRDQRDDRPTVDAAGRGRSSKPTQPHVGRVGELLLPGPGQQSLSDRGSSRSA